jgi:hypothetical protein
MTDKTVQIVDQSCGIVATAQVAETDGVFAGLIDLRSMPADLRRRFEAYEEIVNSQMFSLLDEMEEQIAEIQLVAIFEEGEAFPVEDLQIYPSEGRVSFKVAPSMARQNGHATYSDRLHDMPRTQAESQNQA